MKMIVGIDEAGYSPLLGPLVVSAAAFEVLDTPTDWWTALTIPRACDKAADFDLPPVDDSKKLYKPANGPIFLERAVFAFLGASGYRPASLRELLACVAPPLDLSVYPWYRYDDVALPVAADPIDISHCTEKLKTALEMQGCRFVGFRSEPLPVVEYNRRVDSSGNKAHVLMNTTLGLVEQHLRPDVPAVFYIDKQGARNVYSDMLSQYFFGSMVHTRNEGKNLSSYELHLNNNRAELHFCIEGDAAHLPIALASMISKYIRELFLLLLNRYWSARYPDLPRTSGYRTDGRQFIERISTLPEFDEGMKSLLIRSK